MIMVRSRMTLGLVILAFGLGCSEPLKPLLIVDHGITGDRLPQGGITVPLAPPTLGPPVASKENLPATPPEKAAEAPSGSPLGLNEVLESVAAHFPLVLAAEQERAIAGGQRLAAEGGFDTNFKGRVLSQGGTFPNNRLDSLFEQPTPLGGVSLLAGYRYGFGEFPVYYGDRLTADDGEFRAGLQIPLLKDSAIDRRRALLEQAKINENLADPVVRRVRIDAFRAAAKSYWNWVAAGEQVHVAQSLLRIARERQAGLEEQSKKGQIAEFVVIDNRRLVVEREGVLVGAERRWQQSAFDLSLYLRDPQGNPVIAQAPRLPGRFLEQEPVAPPAPQLADDIDTAWKQRPELARFQFLRERLMIDIRFNENQMLPALNLGAFASQDLGPGKKLKGLFALERTVYEGGVTLEVPLQRRDARGKTQAANAAMSQLLVQERFARDTIQAEVQDVYSAMDRAIQRVRLSREEQKIAERVADLERERFLKGQSNLLEVNLRELAAASARAKVIESLADFQRARIDYRAALGRVDDR
jgi:cobalt-zinc-cadmium efflux system outer membrane protein